MSDDKDIVDGEEETSTPTEVSEAVLEAFEPVEAIEEVEELELDSDEDEEEDPSLDDEDIGADAA